jgi:putative phosphoribosyl transferase
MRFRDRSDAGQQLGARLRYLRGEDVVVLGLPRGGVAVAAEVARIIAAPLDVILVRKLGVPVQPELGMGAIGEGGARVINRDVVTYARVSDADLAAVEERERAELQRRAARYRRQRPRLSLTGRTAVIVDDGIATGSTARAACAVAKAQGAKRVVLAVPVAPAAAAGQFARDADEFVCLAAPEQFMAIGEWYNDFSQTSDDEVIRLLDEAAASREVNGGSDADGGNEVTGAFDGAGEDQAAAPEPHAPRREPANREPPAAGWEQANPEPPGVGWEGANPEPPAAGWDEANPEHHPPGPGVSQAPARDEEVMVQAGEVSLPGHLTIPRAGAGIVVFAHGSGSSRHSPRNGFVAGALAGAGLGTLLFDLLTPGEEADRANVFNVELLAGRLADATRWLRRQPGAEHARIGYFGASTGAAAALRAAAEPGSDTAAVVSRGGRPDLAQPVLTRVRAPTLLIVGARDDLVIEMNRRAREQLRCESKLVLVPGATHLFEEPGTLQQAAALARAWFTRHLTPARAAG